MQDDYEIPDVSELSDQEYAEHMFIEQQLSSDEIINIAFACERVEDIVQAQYYFARARQEGSFEILSLLDEITEDRLKISGVRLGVPEFVFYS